MTAPVAKGTPIRYHGSLAEYHGRGTVRFAANLDHPEVKSDDGHRYVLELNDGTPLFNVRRQSFTVLGDADV